jgi:copper oxidase (laccase) domain-containing protein
LDAIHTAAAEGIPPEMIDAEAEKRMRRKAHRVTFGSTTGGSDMGVGPWVEKNRAKKEKKETREWEKEAARRDPALREQERQARDTLAELYRERRLQKSYGAEDL